ncbi:MAG: acetate kinase [Burkholderiaceae bacterium]|nr:MAG: acetate kinase [Burkholderiaceae bacterium]
MNNKTRQHRPIALLACSALALSSAMAQAQSAPPAGSDAQIDSLQQQLIEQGRQIEALKRATAEQEKKYQALRRALSQQARDAQPGETAQGANTEPGASAQTEQNPQDTQQHPVQVGVAPSRESQVPIEVPRLFEQPGILTPKGKFVLEPSLEYSYSSNNRVALIGYTIIPALVIGLIDVQQVKDSILTGALTGRYGLTNRMEVEAKIPYVYRSDSSVGRELNTGSATDSVFNSSGKAIGDIEMTARYQLNEGGNNKPYLIGSLRFKSRTGKDPFEVVTDCLTSCVGNPGGTGLPTTQPTGSGFYLLQPALTWLFQSDPAVFFGTVSYAHNFARHNVSLTVLGGQQEFLGTVKAGDIIGANFGMGLALNEKSAFSVGVDLNSVGRTLQNGVPVTGSVRVVLAKLLFGFSYRYNEKTTLNLTVGAGLTRDTPDLTLNLRIPFSL